MSPGTLYSNSIICSISISPHFFFKSILSRKNWRGAGGLIFKNSTIDGYACSVADLGGGDGGDASPPTSLKVTILAEKTASVSNNSAPFRDASPPPT